LLQRYGSSYDAQRKISKYEAGMADAQMKISKYEAGMAVKRQRRHVDRQRSLC
jgi:hypothetical protein